MEILKDNSILDAIYNFYFTLNNMSYKQYKVIEKQKNIIETIKIIEKLTKDKKIEKNLYKNLVSFIFGNFIEITFLDNEKCFYLFKNDVLSSKTLYNFFYIHENENKNNFKLNIKLNKYFFNIIINYLLYNENRDNIGTLIYNNSIIYLKDKDNYNNNLIFHFTYNELIKFQEYLKYFQIKVLDFKVNLVIDIFDSLKYVNLDKNISLNRYL